jgi:uracil-DNA glycosylase family 4
MNEKIKNDILSCKKCAEALLEFNDNSLSQKGYGKLFGYRSSNKTRYMLVGLNPSHKRYENMCMNAFKAGTHIEDLNQKIHGDMFLYMLSKLEIIENCYFTNAIKCSTINNKVNDTMFNNCFNILKSEIEYIKPEFVVALGNEVFNFLSAKNIENLVKVHHPNYYFSYRRSELKNYILEFKNLENL